MREPPRACVIGAGLAGLAAARALSRQGIPFECFERREAVGGACASAGGARLDVSRQRLQFAEWPMPGSYPPQPSGRHLAAYLRDYAARFGLDARIRLGSEVTAASPLSGGGWEVELGGVERRRYDALVVAAGRGHSRRPASTPPGDFAGEQIDGGESLDEAALRDRDVIVVGAGADAADVAVISSYLARSTQLSLHRPRYALPQIAMGRPPDRLPLLPYLLGRGIGPGPLSFQLPRALRDRALRAAHRGMISPRLHGLPLPAEPPSVAGAVLAPHLLERLLHGRIAVRPGIARFEGPRVRFADGGRADADLIVWSVTGPPQFPFLPAEAAPAKAGRLELLWNVFPPGRSDLAFVGLAEPDAGSPTAIAECQAELVAARLAGSYAPPHHGAPPRGGVRVGELDYVRRARRELRAGRRRARQRAR